LTTLYLLNFNFKPAKRWVVFTHHLSRIIIFIFRSHRFQSASRTIAEHTAREYWRRETRSPFVMCNQPLESG
jgi:hypothetical protein